MMEIYSDQSITYNSEGFARLYGWWSDDEEEEDFIRPKKDKKDNGTDNLSDDSTPWDEIN